ncbi:replication initiation protein [Solidesulfovibrio magneticus]|uniref:Uncharacterized protein n=1 Tax=Solidesulfovibrio magneticus (strain ATCC 700980 / DSM 13731 / RS-1) TaxID=573370 RepID=C4XTR3_SOLM1|nr:replication initiation protein [Solidesulfovibrio magneticus]BAH73578.1 hypothetical protein DMR_00870 [Solidesulfovibrio magneticus RS-1]
MVIPCETSPELRFYNYLSPRPRWGNSKVIRNIGKKEEIINIAAYIQMPNHRKQYLSFDLDYECAASVWMDEGLPEPTLIVINNENSHAHLHYELTVPLLLPIRGRKATYSSKAKRYYDSVVLGLCLRMNGDMGFNGSNIKNPFYQYIEKKQAEITNVPFTSKWKVHWANYTYDLNELNEYGLDIKNIAVRPEIDPTSRNQTLFDSCRKHAYKIVKQYKDEKIFHQAVEIICNQFYEMYLKDIVKDHPYTLKEVASVARSISEWTWRHKNDPSFPNLSKNRGVMGLTRTFQEKGSPEHLQEIRECEQKGAYYTHRVRRAKTISKITEAVNYLTSNGIQVDYKEIVRMTGLSLSRVYGYKDLIDSLDIKI